MISDKLTFPNMVMTIQTNVTKYGHFRSERRELRDEAAKQDPLRRKPGPTATGLQRRVQTAFTIPYEPVITDCLQLTTLRYRVM